MIDRRACIVAAAGLALGLPGRAQSRQSGLPVIGFLRAGAAPAPFVEAFLEGLRGHGFIVGQNVLIERRLGSTDDLRRLADELVGLNVDVILASASSAALAARQATNTIPIVMAAVYHPVELGLVPALGRPGGHITGTAVTAGDMAGKRLELLHDLVPTLARIVMLTHPGHASNGVQQQTAEAAARAIGVAIDVVEVRSESEYEAALASLSGARALMHADTPLFNSSVPRLVAAVARARIPAIHSFKEYCTQGGLMSYGADIPDLFRRSAGYVARILKGASPADLPVEQPTKFELAINLKTAKELGLTIPPALMLRADEVIE